MHTTVMKVVGIVFVRFSLRRFMCFLSKVGSLLSHAQQPHGRIKPELDKLNVLAASGLHCETRDTVLSWCLAQKLGNCCIYIIIHKKTQTIVSSLIRFTVLLFN
jgi:hypothetical protein